MPTIVCTTGSYSPSHANATPKPSPRRARPPFVCSPASYRLQFMTRKAFEFAVTPAKAAPKPKSPAQKEKEQGIALSTVFQQVMAHKGQIAVQFTDARYS